MKRLNILILLTFLTTFPLFSQTVFYEDFENGDPFLEDDTSTEFTFAGNEDCLEESYVIGDNLNSVCSDHEDSPNPNGNCMSVRLANEASWTPFYVKSNLDIIPGQYKISFKCANTTKEGGDIQTARILFRTDESPNVVKQLEYGSEWIKYEIITDIKYVATEFLFFAYFMDVEQSFAIDDIKIELLCMKSGGRAFINEEPGPVHQTDFCFGTPIFAYGTSYTGDCFAISLSKVNIGSQNWSVLGTKNYCGIPFNESIIELTEEFDFNPNLYLTYRITVKFYDEELCENEFFYGRKFRVWDCCESGAEIESQVTCLDEGQTGKVTVALDNPLEFSMIESIASLDNQYTYFSHSEGLDPNKVIIEFTSNGCSCTGNPINFEVYLEDCPDPIILQTDPIPCCSNNCDNLEQDGSWVPQPCLIVNGDLAYKVCFDFITDDPVLDIIPGPASMPCNNTLAGIQWEEFDDVFEVCGYLFVDDPFCVQNSATVFVERENQCCELTVPYNLEDCDISPCFDQGIPEIESIYNPSGENHYVEISIPGASDGDIIVVTNNKTGMSSNHMLTTIKCGPFGITRNGRRIGGIACSGIRFLELFDCETVNSEEETCYDLTIEIGDCSYILVGDYCDEFIYTPPPIGPIQGLVNNGGNNDNSDVMIYPNPITDGQLLNIEHHKTIASISIFNLHGQLVYSNDKINSSVHQVATAALENGLYLIQIESLDDKVINKRIQIFK
jgi:hypothetical protein